MTRYGEIPHRDFLDPGYLLTLYSSATVQRLFGDHLLGEALLTSTFLAAGFVLVFWLSLKLTQSRSASILAALWTVALAPRPYDYDKVFFYGLGVLLCWRWLEWPSRRNLTWLAMGTIVAASFRYDSGLFIFCAVVVGTVVQFGPDWLRTSRRLAAYAGALLLIGAPGLLFVQASSGIGDYVDQLVTYARREGARTRLFSVPALSLSWSTTVPVSIRWQPGLSDVDRIELERRFELDAPEPERGRTWAYTLRNSSPDNLRALVSHPQVQDTDGFDRVEFADPLAWRRQVARLYRENKSAALYVVFLAVALSAVPCLWRRSRQAPRHDRTRLETAKVLSLLTLVGLVDTFILREPIAARLGGAAAPTAVLAAWTVSRKAARLGRLPRLVIAMTVVVFGAVEIASLVSTMGKVELTGNPLTLPQRVGARLRHHLLELGTSDAGEDVFPRGALIGLTDYIDDCTEPADRVLAGWFAPEVYFFSKRRFSGGMVVFFGGHWSEARFHTRIVETLETSPPRIAILPAPDDDFKLGYPAVYDHLTTHYQIAGTWSDGESDYSIMTGRGDRPTSLHAPTLLPCFR